MDIIQVTNNTSGNPRFVVHFLDLLTNEERNQDKDIDELYDMAAAKAKKIRKYSRKYNGKSFGGGIVFTCYKEEVSRICNEIKNTKNKH